MRSALIALGVVFLFCGTSSGEVLQNPNASASVQAFVQNFYNWYLPIVFDDSRKEDSISVATGKMKEVFSPELLSALNDDLKASSESRGEIVGLDYDPFLNSQDPCEKYEVGNVVTKSDSATVEIYAACGGKKGLVPSVLVSLVRQNGHWIFIDFGTVSNHHELTETLKELKRNRLANRDAK